MANGCRDCRQCTESALAGLVLALPRLAWWSLTFWNIGLARRKCPACGHWMSQHQRRADGSLRD